MKNRSIKMLIKGFGLFPPLLLLLRTRFHFYPTTTAKKKKELHLPVSVPGCAFTRAMLCARSLGRTAHQFIPTCLACTFCTGCSRPTCTHVFEITIEAITCKQNRQKIKINKQKTTATQHFILHTQSLRCNTPNKVFDFGLEK